MKRTLKTVATVALAGFVVASCSSLNKMKRLEKNIAYKVTPEMLEAKGGQVDLKIDATIPAKYFNKKVTLVATPVLKFQNGGEKAYDPKTFQGEKVQGEKLNITLHASNPYSSEGIPMKDLTLLKEGELKAIHGNARFAYYLGVEPTGIYSAVKLDNGTKAFEEMKKEPYLYVVSFSDFSMDSLSGYFGGEIRLAYLSDGEKVTPVTGGSVSGNLLELQKDMAFSTERYKDKDYDGPFAVEFHGVAVAGK